MIMTNLDKNIESYLEKMADMGIIDLDDIQGCSLDEIADLEEKYSIRLPASYRSFLLHLGKKFGNLVDRNEYDIDYESVLRMTEEEKNFIKEANEDPEEASFKELIELPEKALLILGRIPDGAQFYFIPCEGGEDSEVHYYNSDTQMIKKAHDSFWDVLDMFLKGRKISYA
jgi:hypothetical protein